MEIHTQTCPAAPSASGLLHAPLSSLCSSKNGFFSLHLNEGENNFLQFSPNYEPKNACFESFAGFLMGFQ